MTTFSRWLPAITQTPIIRKAALTAAGLAFVGGSVAGPATAAFAAPTQSAPVSSVQSDRHGSDRAHDRRDNDRRDNDRRDSDRRDPARSKEVGIRYESQPNFYYCGPASTRIALTAEGKNLSQDEVAKQLGTTEAGTNSAEDITRVLNKVTGKDVYKTTEIPTKPNGGHVDKLSADIVRAVDGGRAAVANIAGTASDTDGVAHSYEGGHYVSVVGYRDGGATLKIADPANPDQASYWVTAEDLANWIATRGYSA